MPHTQVALPAGEDKDGRVTLEGTGENLYPLYPEAHPGQRSELVLAQPLQLANKDDEATVEPLVLNLPAHPQIHRPPFRDAKRFEWFTAETV